MNDTTQWLLAQEQAQADAATTFEDRAFFLALKQFITDQAVRLEQAAGEVDGRAWDHQQW